MLQHPEATNMIDAVSQKWFGMRHPCALQKDPGTIRAPIHRPFRGGSCASPLHQDSYRKPYNKSYASDTECPIDGEPVGLRVGLRSRLRLRSATRREHRGLSKIHLDAAVVSRVL